MNLVTGRPGADGESLTIEGPRGPRGLSGPSGPPGPSGRDGEE